METNSSMLAFAWLLLAATCIIMILIGLNSALKRTTWEQQKKKRIFLVASLSIIVWSGLLLLFSYNGFFEDFSTLPPKPVLAMLVPLPVMFLIAFSKTGTQLLKTIPPHWLVFMQSFRVVVELLILFAFIYDKLPVQMTFEGKNFDILTGMLALPVGYILTRRKTYSVKLAIAYNIIGVLLLINILVIAVLSMPTSLQYFTNEPANTLVGQFPFIVLPGILVPIAYTFHIFSLRQLLSNQKSPQATTALPASGVI